MSRGDPEAGGVARTDIDPRCYGIQMNWDRLLLRECHPSIIKKRMKVVMGLECWKTGSWM